MANINIFEGGTASNRSSNRMYPSEAAGVCRDGLGYADHQRARNYGVTRRLDLRAPAPFAGGGKDQALVDFLVNSPPLVVGDVLRTHLLPPNTVLQAVSLGVMQAVPGFQFSVSVVSAAVPTIPVFTTVNAGAVPMNSDGCPLALYTVINAPAAYASPIAGVLIQEQSYLAITIVALPAGGLPLGCGDNGLNMWLTAHVLDLDHGNA